MEGLPITMPPLLHVTVVTSHTARAKKKEISTVTDERGTFLPAFDRQVLMRSLGKLAANYDSVELHPSITCATTGTHDGLSIEEFAEYFGDSQDWSSKRDALESFGFTCTFDSSMHPPRAALVVVLRATPLKKAATSRAVVCDSDKNAQSRAKIINDIGRHAFSAALRHWPRGTSGQFFTKSPAKFCPPELRSKPWNITICHSVYLLTFGSICDSYMLTPEERPSPLPSKEFNRKLQA